MPHRIDVELTSSRDDGSWTWRAAGARQPKGVLDGSILYQGAKVGDVLRAEAEFEVDGITITSVQPPRDKRSETTERLEIIGPPREPRPGVTTTLVSRSERRRPPRGGFGEGDRRDRSERPPRPREDGDGRRRGDQAARRPDQPGRRTDQPARRSDQPGRRPDRRTAAGRGRPEGEGATAGAPRTRPARPRPEEAPAHPAPKRLTPGNTHRNAVLASLAPEQRPIAEQLLRGGLPAVRQAIAAETAKAKAEGRAAISAEPLLAMAEEILPRLKTATWRDRAEAASAAVDEIGLRDLRSVVTSADAAARDDETRLLASNLRQALDRRVEEQRQAWLRDITASLDENRVVRALRLSSRPPDPTTRFPAELALRLAEAAGAALAPDTPPDRWVALLDAVSASPVRRNVKPAGLPADPPEQLMHAAHQAAGRVPAVATLLGLAMPPPPGPARPLAPRPPRPPRPGADRRPASPRPPRPAPAAAPAPSPEATPVEQAVAPAPSPEATPVEQAVAPAEHRAPPAEHQAPPAEQAARAPEPEPSHQPEPAEDAARPEEAPSVAREAPAGSAAPDAASAADETPPPAE